MAHRLSALYPGQVDSSDPAGYPYGKPRNVTVSGDGTGTPLEREWMSDLHGFLQALLRFAGISPSDVADKVGASQYLDAVRWTSEVKIAEMAASNWTQQVPDDSYAGTFLAVTWHTVIHDPWHENNVVFAVGTGGELQRGPYDGDSWQHLSAAGAYSGSFFSVCSNGNLVVAVGELGEIQTSTSGLSWGKRTQDAGYAGTFYSLCWSGSQFVAVGSGGEIQTSPDGINWTQQTADDSYSGTFRGVVWSGSQFVAVGSGGEIQTSPDGVNWTHQVPGGGFVGTFNCVAAKNGTILAIGSSGTLRTSENGTSWESHAGLSLGVTGLVASKELFVCVCTEGLVFSSPDGVTWTRRDHILEYPASSLYGIAWSGRKLAAVGSAGKIISSLREL